jgi:hypothetical protein
MEKTALKTFLVALLLGLISSIFFRLGELQAIRNELRTEDDFILLSGYSSRPWNKWDYAGGLSLLIAFSFAFAALIFWQRNRDSD